MRANIPNKAVAIVNRNQDIDSKPRVMFAASLIIPNKRNGISSNEQISAALPHGASSAFAFSMVNDVNRAAAFRYRVSTHQSATSSAAR